MAPQYPNLYQRGRKTTLLTQEEAAERLGISPETLKRYEGGRLTPPDETVARMCEVYGARWLALEHAKATDRLGILPELEPKPLPMATISLTNRLRDAADRLAGLLRIAEDGVIDESERPEFDAIVADLRETIAAAYQVIYAADAKKERPEAATSERSGEKVCGLGKTTVGCINYSTRSTTHASPNFRREGGVSL